MCRPTTKLLFYLVCALLPVACLPGLPVPYREPKLFLYWTVASLCGFHLARRFLRGEKLSVAWAHGAITALFFMRIIAYSPTVNVGLYLQSLGLTGGALLFSLYCYNGNLNLRLVSFLVLGALAPSLLQIFTRIIFGTPVFPFVSSLGGFIGERNSASVLVVQAIPLLWWWQSSQKLRFYSTALITLAGSLLVAFAVWERTRSAWWMLIIYAVGLSYAFAKSKNKRLGQITLQYFAMGILAVGWVRWLPNHLHWKSGQPYADDLESLASWRSSSGRDQLWTVGWKMARDNPWRGVGTGNFPVFFRGYVQKTDADPSAFAFLRPDLPLFNDYLQCAVENGFLAAVFFLVLVLGLSFTLYFRALVSPASFPLFMSLSGLAIAADAFFDSPLSRPETLFLFTILISLGFKSLVASQVKVFRRPAWFLFPMSATLFLLAIVLGLSFGLRWIFRNHPSHRVLEVSYALWPWDTGWDGALASARFHAGDGGGALRYTQRRKHDWPEDPLTFLISAETLWKLGRLSEAQKDYNLSRYEIKNGRPFEPGYRRYNEIFRELPDAARKNNNPERGSH